jgi:hypothetical protein
MTLKNDLPKVTATQIDDRRVIDLSVLYSLSGRSSTLSQCSAVQTGYIYAADEAKGIS